MARDVMHLLEHTTADPFRLRGLNQCYVMLNELVNCPTLLIGYPTHSVMYVAIDVYVH